MEINDTNTDKDIVQYNFYNCQDIGHNNILNVGDIDFINTEEGDVVDNCLTSLDVVSRYSIYQQDVER